jgi:flagellar hook-associated protein 1 FlgK
MGFEASKSAIFASQKALDVVGQNLANMSTEGYTRQRADQVSVSNEEYRSRISGSAYNHLGMGTSVEGISQVRDDRMDTAFRNSYSDTSYYRKEHDMLNEIETIMSEIDAGVDGNGYGLGYGIKEMYLALTALQEDVSLDANSTIFADSVKNICSILNRTSAELTEAKASYVNDFKYV